MIRAIVAMRSQGQLGPVGVITMINQHNARVKK